MKTFQRRLAQPEADQAAKELADFWFAPFRTREWEERLDLLEKIDEEIRNQCETEDIYHYLSGLFTTLLIERLGTEPIRSRAQAYGYLNASRGAYRQPAIAWLVMNDPDSPVLQTEEKTGAVGGAEKRTAVRHAVELSGIIAVNDNEFDGKVVDISKTGARVATSAEIPRGTRVRVRVPMLGQVTAVVAWASATFIGLTFISPHAGATVLGV